MVLEDRRARLRAKPGQEDRIYGIGGFPSLMRPLQETNGMIWPYTPTIAYSQAVDYQPYNLVHVNQEPYAYSKTQTLNLSVVGNFTAQNPKEARYCLACIHYLRSVTKMNFGSNDPNRGTPPPTLLFSAWGDYIFNDLPVVVQSFTVDFPGDVDYVDVDVVGEANISGQRASNILDFLKDQRVPRSLVPVDTSIDESLIRDYRNRHRNPGALTRQYRQSGNSQVPSRFLVSVQLIYQQTPEKWRSEFNLDDFRNGRLLRRGGWV